MKQIGLRLDEGLLERIDARRGDVPRETWIRRQLEAAVGNRLSTDTQHRVRNSSQARREVVPIPKGKR